MEGLVQLGQKHGFIDGTVLVARAGRAQRQGRLCAAQPAPALDDHQPVSKFEIGYVILLFDPEGPELEKFEVRFCVFLFFHQLL